MRRPTLSLTFGVATLTAACGSALPAPDAPSVAPPAPSSIAEVHTRKCGACHALPERGTRARADLERAFVRHRKRVHLEGEQWRELVDYLARPDGP
ncbi:MAG: hypothetical protein FWD17_07980 [Polyangiaceae bacterium]|nr:hypothetical protein [Polyangiaceae bacterium]